MQQLTLRGAASNLATQIVCSGCGYLVPPEEPYPFRCPRAVEDDEIDHILHRSIDPQVVGFPTGMEKNPFVRYRTLLSSYHLATAYGLLDHDYLDMIDHLDTIMREAEEDENPGLCATPFGRNQALSELFGFVPQGGIWIKDETKNLGGSHKIRHFMATALHFEVVERLGLEQREDGLGASLSLCGSAHAALAGAFAARAAGRILEAFVPLTNPRSILARVRALGVKPQPCARSVGNGDHLLERFQHSLEAGALPLTCISNQNGLSLEGGSTLTYEIVSDLLNSGGSIDRLVVQTGTGALLGSALRALLEVGEMGFAHAMPRVHAVQSAVCMPLARAYERLTRRIIRRLEKALPQDPPCPEDQEGYAMWLRERAWSPIVQEELEYATSHRSAFMWSWDEPSSSRAQSLLEPEVSEWRVILEAMIRTGGYPIAVDEATLMEANQHVQEQTDIDADYSGTAGLAGLIALSRTAPLDSQERVALIFSGSTF